MSKYHEDLERLRESYAASSWLKDAADELDARDPVDALADADALAALAKSRVDGLFARQAAPEVSGGRKICKDCRFYVDAGRLGAAAKCGFTAKPSLVDGSLVMGFCEFERADSGSCKPIAMHFERRLVIA
jgi:hypothetical protein